MCWCTAAGRLGVLLLILVTSAAPRKSTCLGTYQTIPPPEPNCTEGLPDITVCACDPECTRYGECCPSSPYFTKEEQRLGASPFTCKTMAFTQMSLKMMYVMTECPTAWNDSDTRSKCENPDITHRDPLLDAPVTSTSTNITYQNWHCAYCHGDLDAETTVIWDAEFTCSGSSLKESLFNDTLADHLSFNPITSEWWLNINESTSDMGLSLSPPYSAQGSEYYSDYQSLRCKLTFIAPAMELPARWCHTGIISSCSKNWTDNEVKTQCEEYTARVCSGSALYRNYHCLLCNNLVDTKPCCLVEPFVRRGFEPTLTMLLNWRKLKRNVCTSSEIYDPPSRVCRQVFV